jgi:hypothetical protein
MSEQNRISQSVMEGGGAYNQHARHQTAAASAAGQFLERAVRNLTIDHGVAPIVIADYGSSQGKNSQAPMRSAIESLRPRLAPTRPIFVYHVDQPSNDFNTLFETLTGPESYTRPAGFSDRMTSRRRGIVLGHDFRPTWPHRQYSATNAV